MDKFTRVSYSRGQEYEGTVERMAFLQKAGYLEDAPLPLPGKKSEEVAESNTNQLMTKKELEKELDKRGISYNKRMNKQQLADLLERR